MSLSTCLSNGDGKTACLPFDSASFVNNYALFFFEPMQPHGCGGHPDVADHAILAKELEPFFKKLL